MSRTEKTINFLFISTFVGWFIKFFHVPFVYFVRRVIIESDPSIPLKPFQNPKEAAVQYL